MIKIAKIDATTYDVTVSAHHTTVHRIAVPSAYALKLTAGKVSTEVLLQKSFEFLLEREANTSILSSFELSVIGRYFPEYEATIRASIS